MTDHDCGHACPEYNELSRRQFMALSAAGVSAAMIAPSWLPRVALARDYRAQQRDVIISVFLRGACDGLNIVPPHGDALYYSNRPTENVPQPGQANGAINLNGYFGFHPAMAPLMPAYANNHLLVIHAAGSTDPSRSHFDAQRFMEVGKPQDPSVGTGWLGRHLLATDPMDPNALLRAVGINTGLPKTLVGGPLTLPVPDLDTFGLLPNNSTMALRKSSINSMFDATPEPLRSVGLNTLATIDLLNTINFVGYTPAGGASYPAGNTTAGRFGYALKTSAALVKAQVGVEAIAIDINGWDTHNQQGTASGTFFQLVTALASGLGAFYTDMITGGTSPTFIVTVMSEFGRRLSQNGSSGSDHGHGNVMLVLGNAIAGGRVLAQWPGLAPANLFQGIDLDVTTDYRDILAEILAERAGSTQLGYVFPDYSPTFRGVLA